MNTKEITPEQISAFADGELSEQQVDVVLAALRQAEGRADWEAYHQIGDVLRSDDMDINLSPGFAARMAARLDMEPTIIVPVIADGSSTSTAADQAGGQRMVGLSHAKSTVKRWAMPGMAAAAAMAAVAFVATPQLMVATNNEAARSGAPITVASSESATSSPATLSPEMKPAVLSTDTSEGVVLRDPRIDEYLLAHQRFSPFVYSTAQYARSATFANESNK